MMAQWHLHEMDAGMIMTEGSEWLRLEERCWKVQQMMVMATEWNNESVESGWSSHQRRWRYWCRSRSQSSTSPTDERYNVETLLNADHLRKTHRSLLKTQIGADNPPPETWIGTDDTEKSQMTQMIQISSDEHRMQQREDGLAHNLLEIMLPHELRIQIIKWMTTWMVK